MAGMNGHLHTPWPRLLQWITLQQMTGRTPAAIPEWVGSLRIVRAALLAGGFLAEQTGDRVAFQAPPDAPALLEPPEPGGRWTLRVFYVLGKDDRPRVAARTFAAQHGGKLSLKGARLTVSSGLPSLDPQVVIAAYRAACHLREHLDRARLTAR